MKRFTPKYLPAIFDWVMLLDRKGEYCSYQEASAQLAFLKKRCRQLAAELRDARKRNLPPAQRQAHAIYRH